MWSVRASATRTDHGPSSSQFGQLVRDTLPASGLTLTGMAGELLQALPPMGGDGLPGGLALG
jgi:hypothetical protein